MASKVLIVTGGGRGIGAAICQLAAEAGYDVCINYQRDSERAEAVASACREAGAKALIVQGDVGCEDDVAALFSRCDEVLGPATHLVNNAGVLGARARLDEVSPSALRRVMEVNILGAMLCAQAAVRRMSTVHGGAGGAIVNVSSIAATLGSPGEYVHYAATKGAVDTFTIGLAKEVGPEGIRVNAVQSGTVATEVHAKAGNPDRPAMVAATAPLKRVAEPMEIAEAVLWLLSDKASYATGTVMRVGGGL